MGMIRNINCIHQNVCTMLGDKGYCRDRCKEYIYDDDDRLIRNYFEINKDLPLPYDMISGFDNLRKSCHRFIVVDRMGELLQ